MKKRTLLFVFGLVLALGVIAIFLTANQVKAQQDIVGELQTRLLQQDVPLESIKISNYFPLQIEVVLESQSTGALVSPDDPLYVGVAQREIAAARMRGRKIERVQIAINNREGKEITRADLSVDPALDNTTIVPSKVSDDALEEAVRSQLLVGKLVLEDFTIVHTADGGQLIQLKLTARELADLNQVLPGLVTQLSRALLELKKEQGAQIPGFSLEVFGANGESLLKYSAVYEASREKSTWWMANGVSQDWFPHPLPTTAP
ncbi:MAG: hypothetical protein B6D41_13100 [Chloroflexi bacterium UTCFX4]|jgi:hypothetical protein|nr:MAG: hypothetical protein B6D41_13100 [Chloroflexi bacterium UTCFX4]